MSHYEFLVASLIKLYFSTNVSAYMPNVRVDRWIPERFLKNWNNIVRHLAVLRTLDSRYYWTNIVRHLAVLNTLDGRYYWTSIFIWYCYRGNLNKFKQSNNCQFWMLNKIPKQN